MTLSSRSLHIGSFVAGLVLAASATAADYRVVREFRIPGAGGWDYLTFDAAGERLFITRGDRVQVVDPADGALLGEVLETSGVHGVALVPALGKGYTSNGRAGTIGVFDLKTLKMLSTVVTPEGTNPDFIVYDDATQRVVAFNGGTANASVVGVSSDRLLKTIALPGKPEAAVPDGKGSVYVNIEDHDQIAVIDLVKGSMVGVLALPGCEEPAGLAFDADTRRLFVGCHNNTLVVVNADTRQVVATLPIGRGVDATTFDPATKLVFSSQGDGTLTVIREASADRFDLVQNVMTRPSARTMALNPKTHEVYVVSAEFDEGAPTTDGTRPRRTLRAGTFRLTVLADH